MQVLIIEPTKSYADMLGNILLRTQALVTRTASADDGLDLLRDREMDLVLLAQEFPDRSAADLAREIRSLPRHRDTPILVLANDSSSADRDGYFRAGITDILNQTNLEAMESTLLRFMDCTGLKLKGKVLYVEDTPRVAAATLNWLQDMGLQADHFQTAEKALDAFVERDYDLVITDILLGGAMSGIGLINQIRHLSSDRQRTPVLALTGESDQARKVEILKLGANDLAGKSCAREEFQVRVCNLVRQKQMMDTLIEQKKQLFEMATRDQLTGLYNRHFLVEQSPRAISQARRHGRGICVMILDLDHFKDINDSYGHAAGDHVLRETGALLQKSLRSEDLAARFGGEEFIVIMGHCNLQQGQQLAERIRLELEQLQPAGIPVTASIGISAWEGDGAVSFDELFRQADLAVYRAKAAGRNKVFVARELSEAPFCHVVA